MLYSKTTDRPNSIDKEDVQLSMDMRRPHIYAQKKERFNTIYL